MQEDALGRPQLAGRVWIHASAVVVGDVVLADDVSVWPMAVIRGDRDRITIGVASNVQDGAVLHADPGVPCTIGARVTIGHRAVVHGATVEDGALIGIGAIVLNGAVVGAGALVAAGAVVPEGMVVPPGMLVRGVPAKVVGPLSAEQAERVARGWETYVGLKDRYKGSGGRG